MNIYSFNYGENIRLKRSFKAKTMRITKIDSSTYSDVRSIWRNAYWWIFENIVENCPMSMLLKIWAKDLSMRDQRVWWERWSSQPEDLIEINEDKNGTNKLNRWEKHVASSSSRIFNKDFCQRFESFHCRWRFGHFKRFLIESFMNIVVLGGIEMAAAIFD